MQTTTEARCLQCTSRFPTAGAQRLCPSCVTDLGKRDDHKELAAALRPGDRVKVVQGVFAGLAAQVIASDARIVRAKTMIMTIPLEVDYLPWQLRREQG